MTEKGYRGFGSHIVLEPHSPKIPENISKGDPSAQCQKLKLQLKYFTIRAYPDDCKNGVSASDLTENANCEKFKLYANPHSDGELLVVETASCESFHSCHSSTSNTETPSSTQGQEEVQKGRQHSRNKSSDEDFIDHITMVNAIFLNKKVCEKSGKVSGDKVNCVKKEKLLNEATVDSTMIDKSLSSKNDKSSVDKNSKQACLNCKYTSCDKSEANKGIPIPLFKNEKDQKISGTENGETDKEIGLSQHKDEKDRNIIVTEHKKPNAYNSGLKTIRIHRKIVLGTKKPLMSKIIRRKGHQSLAHKLQSMKRREEKCSINVQSPEISHSSESNNEIHKHTILLRKEGIHEGYEIHYFEPILLTNHITIFSKDTNDENSAINIVSCESEGDILNQDSRIINCCGDFDESLLLLLNNFQKSSASVQFSKEMIDTEINTDPKNTQTEINNTSSISNENQDSSALLCEQENFTVLYESESTYSDLSLNELFKHELDKTSDEILKLTTAEKNRSIEKNVEEGSKENSFVSLSDRSTEIERENIKETNNSSNPLYTSNNESHLNVNIPAKRRRSFSRKSSLPVIEESPELVQESSDAYIEEDYCLVDTLGRPIHLFDSRGLPLTDGSGRPLKSADGELLLKCDSNGIPIVDEKTQIFDMMGRQPHEEEFQPWMSPQDARYSRLSFGDGRPLVMFDMEGRPLTSISGTMLVDNHGQSLLKLGKYVVNSPF